MASLVVILLLCVCCILLGAIQGSRVGWAVVALGCVALLVALLGRGGVAFG